MPFRVSRARRLLLRGGIVADEGQEKLLVAWGAVGRVQHGRRDDLCDIGPSPERAQFGDSSGFLRYRGHLLPTVLAQGPEPGIPPHVSALRVYYLDAVSRRELCDLGKDLFGPSNVSVAMDPIRSKRTLASHLLPLEIRFCWTLPGRKPDRQQKRW